MPFHLLPNQQAHGGGHGGQGRRSSLSVPGQRQGSRRASESAAALASLPGGSPTNPRSAIKEMLQSSLSSTSSNNTLQTPPTIVINTASGRPRSSSLGLIKKKLSISSVSSAAATAAASGNGSLAATNSNSNGSFVVNTNHRLSMSNDSLSHTRGRSMSNELYPAASNISMAPGDVASIISSAYEPPDMDRLEKPNKNLITYLQTQGLSEPFRLGMSHHMGKARQQHHAKSFKRDLHTDLEVLVSHNGNMLLLPYVSSKKFARTAAQEANNDDDDDDNDGDGDEEEEFDGNTPTDNRSSIHDSQSAASGAPAVNPAAATVNRINHTFGVVVQLAKKQTLNPVVKAKLVSECTVDWINGIPDSQDVRRTIFNESYKVSKDLVWDLNLDHPDCFIAFPNPDDDESDEDKPDNDDLAFMEDSESSNTNEGTPSANSDFVISEAPSQELKKLEVFNHKERVQLDQDTLDLGEKYTLPPSHLAAGKTYEPGYYVFLLPVLFPPTMAESITSPLGSVSYYLSVKAQPLIVADLRPPQAAAFSTSPSAAKSLYPLQPIASPSTSRARSPSFSRSPAHSPPSSPPSSFQHTAGVGNKLMKTLKTVGNNVSTSIYDHSKRHDENAREFGFELPVIRQPPPDSVTTINKSVYVNKIWNDSLNYEITFPKKYVSMSSVEDELMHNFDLRIKIMPLVKKIYMKRIRVNMIEKITYVSRDMKYEFDYGKEVPVDKGVKERIIPLFEIKTKEKGNSKTPALRSEIVKNCLDDNLLTSCYDAYRPSKRKNTQAPNEDNDQDTFVTNTVKISCPLSFYIKNDNLTRNIRSTISGGGLTSGKYYNDDDDLESVTSVDSASRGAKPSSPQSNFMSMFSKSPFGSTTSLSNNASHGNGNNASAVRTPNTLLKEKYGLFPDVAGFGNISIKHRLQICFRISKLEKPENLKPGDDPNKLHHYEVIIDTPVILNTPFANDHTPPSYDDVVLAPSFGDQQLHGFHIRPVLDEEMDEYEENPPPPPFEFAVGSPINTGLDLESEYRANDWVLTEAFSPYSAATMANGHMQSGESPANSETAVNLRTSRIPSISIHPSGGTGGTTLSATASSSSRHASVSAASGLGFSSTIDELLVHENGDNGDKLRESNLSKLLSTDVSAKLPAQPPEYSQVDAKAVAQHSDAQEMDIGGENFADPEGEDHDAYNKRRIEKAKAQNHVLMKKVEDDLADFSF